MVGILSGVIFFFLSIQLTNILMISTTAQFEMLGDEEKIINFNKKQLQTGSLIHLIKAKMTFT